MITLFVMLLGFGTAALTYKIGKMRQDARWNSRMSIAWRNVVRRVEAGEDPAQVLLDEYAEFPKRMQSWTWKDTKRFVKDDRHRRAAADDDPFAGAFNGPVPPENVRWLLPTGEEIPVECVYVGIQADGLHHWNAVLNGPPEVLRGGAIITDMLPARTAINARFPMEGEL